MSTRKKCFKNVMTPWIFLIVLMINSLCFAHENEIASTARTAKPQDGKLGLHNNASGILMKGEKPYRGIGVCYYFAFFRTILNPADKSYKQGFHVLRDRFNIPFISCTINGWWPNEWQLYVEEKDLYFELLDEFVKEAEKQKLGLVFVFFPSHGVIPDIVGESMEQYGNPKSKTNAFITTYTKEIVSRYKNSPAVWAWVYGHENMLYADISDPKPGLGAPEIWPFKGTPKTRTKQDLFKRDNLRVTYKIFADAVREVDPYRLISTGDAIPRYCSYHLYTKGTWETDTIEQWTQIMRDDTPDPIDSISMHIYPKYNGEYFPEKVNIYDLIGICNEECKKAKKIFFMGEFGVPKSTYKVKDYEMFIQFINAIVDHKIPLSALWVYDLRQQNADWNITEYNDRSYMLELVKAANEKIQKE